MHAEDFAEALGCLHAASEIKRLPADVAATIQYSLADTLKQMRHFESGELLWAGQVVQASFCLTSD